MRSKIFFLFVALMAAAPAGAFSPEFQQKLTALQTRLLLKQEKMTEPVVQEGWKLFDDEAVRLLSLSPALSERKLNGEGKRIKLSITEHEETIELGAGEIKFNLLGSTKKKADWLVTYQQWLGATYASTFHIFRCEKGACERVAAMEEVKGPWNRDWIRQTLIQIQMMIPDVEIKKFASYHLPPHLRAQKSNRSQIVWEWNGKGLKAKSWVAQVDWHQENGQWVKGRGEIQQIP